MRDSNPRQLPYRAERYRCANIQPTLTCAPRSLRPLLADEIRHAELSFAYRLLNRRQGRRLFAGFPVICAASLARKARTVPHYPLSLTVDEVGVADHHHVFFRLAGIPAERRCLSRATFRASLGRNCRRRTIDSEGDRTCLVRPHPIGHGGALSGHAPLPPLPTAIGAKPQMRLARRLELFDSRHKQNSLAATSSCRTDTSIGVLVCLRGGALYASARLGQREILAIGSWMRGRVTLLPPRAFGRRRAL